MMVLISGALGIPAALYLFLPAKSSRKEEWTEVGDLAQISGKTPEEVVFRRKRKDGWKILNEKTSAWIRRISDKEAIAFAPSCTHLGCAYHWETKTNTFICPCHTSAFGLDGSVLMGPAPRPLDQYEVKIENGKLLLGRVIQFEEES
jgi:menaquinol-cytochrome c reductase iron-sulfur subunit